MGSKSIREYRPLRECTSTGSVSYGIVQPGSHVENGVPIIRVNNINDGSLDVTNPLKVDPQIDGKHRKTRLEGGEVLLSLVGTTGQCVVAGPELKGWNVARAIAVIKPAQGISAEWLSICLKSQAAQQYLDNRANTTVQKTLNLKDVREIPIMTVSETEERYILEWWTTLNDKIELNRKMNATLEAMAQALFKSWFVDFDPVIDNALAAGNPIPEALADRAEVRRQALANSTANREAAKAFPDSFQETEAMGWIPKGWDSAKLGDYLEIKRGGSPRPIHDFLSPEGLPWTKIADATASKSRFLFTTKQFIKPEGLKKTVLMKKGSLILSNSATPGLPIFLELDACIHDGWLHFPAKKHFGDLYLYQLFLVIRKELVAQGNGSIFTNLKTDILRAQRIAVPPSALLDVFESWMKPNFEKILALNIESRSLTKLRDTLLPKLISGELRISDAEQLTEEALA